MGTHLLNPRRKRGRPDEPGPAAPHAPAAARAPRRPPLLVGHRGHRVAAYGEAENTLAAFDHALALGCDGLELDLHCTADGHLVVQHDPEIEGVAIAASSYRQLRSLQPALTTLPRVLRQYAHRCWLDLEIKAPGCEAALLAALRRLPPARGYVVSSFDLKVLGRLARSAPKVPLCLNLQRPLPWRRWRELPLVAVAPHVSFAQRWYLARMQRRGLKIVVWTVNQPRRMVQLARAGCDAIISDDPRLLVETLGDLRATPPRALAAHR